MRTKTHLLLLLATLALSLYSTNAFEAGDEIKITVNKISPFANPTESYRYYDLPFCRPENPVEVSQTIGEKLSGNRKVSSLYKTKFLQSINRQALCSVKLSKADLENFKRKIQQHYLFEMFVEEIAVGDYLGFFQEEKPFLSTHIHFKIWYDSINGDIVSAELQTSDVDAIDLSDIKGDINATFYYSVKYMASHSGDKIHVNKGNDVYFAEELHWNSLINAFVLTLSMIVSIWLLITRIVRTDFRKVDIESDRNTDEAKWKLIRIEVFRCPDQRNLLCAAVGSGVQLILVVLLIFLLGAMGMYYSQRGSLHTTGVLLYSFTALIAGLISASIYKYTGGKHWAFNILSTACVFPVVLFSMAFILNNIAWAFRLTSALPFSSILFVIFMWALVTLPLTVFGGLTGRMNTSETLVDVDDKLPKISKPIPQLEWYNQPIFTILLGGLLPFCVVYLELYYVFTSIWGHVIYTMWGMLFIIFVMMLNVTACISIILTYFQLNSLDYRWWWRSFLYGGSGAFYIFAYGVFFYVEKSEMFGFIQTIFFLGYTTVFCSAIFLMLGGVSFLSSLAFVKYIYEKSKAS